MPWSRADSRSDLLLFVYGTLMRGEANAAWLDGARFLSVAQTPPAFTLVNLGPYPGLLANGTTCVGGEVYDVPDHLVPTLDAFEDHPTVYLRGSLALDCGQHAFAYFLRPQYAEGVPVLPGGDWKRRQK